MTKKGLQDVDGFTGTRRDPLCCSGGMWSFSARLSELAVMFWCFDVRLVMVLEAHLIITQYLHNISTNYQLIVPFVSVIASEPKMLISSNWVRWPQRRPVECDDVNNDIKHTDWQANTPTVGKIYGGNVRIFLDFDWTNNFSHQQNVF